MIYCNSQVTHKYKGGQKQKVNLKIELQTLASKILIRKWNTELEQSSKYKRSLKYSVQSYFSTAPDIVEFNSQIKEKLEKVVAKQRELSEKWDKHWEILQQCEYITYVSTIFHKYRQVYYVRIKYGLLGNNWWKFLIDFWTLF